MNIDIVKIVSLVLIFVTVFVGAIRPYGYGYRNNGYKGYNGGGRRKAGRSYTDIARVLNPSPYANPRGVPFPGQPFWPYTG